MDAMDDSLHFARIVFPISTSDLQAASDLVKATGGLVSAVPEFRDGDWLVFAKEQARHDTTFLVYIDSNFMISLLRLFRPARDDQQKIRARTAAMMALAISFGMRVNPTVAIHEYACTGEDNPTARLAMFRYADNLHPQRYADIFQGRASHLPPPSTVDPASLTTVQQPVPKVPVARFTAYYGAVLGLLAIHTDPAMGRLDAAGRKKRMLAFLDWMHKEYIFVSYATLTAVCLWGKEQRCVIVKPGSRNCRQLLRAAKNAAWDLALAGAWAKLECTRNPKNNEPVNLLFTLDRRLAWIADKALHDATLPDENRRQFMLSLAEAFWPPSDASQIVEAEESYRGHLKDGSRPANQRDWLDRGPRLMTELELRIKKNLANSR